MSFNAFEFVSKGVGARVGVCNAQKHVEERNLCKVRVPYAR